MFTLAHLSDIHLSPLPRALFSNMMNKRALGYLNWHLNRKRVHRRRALDMVMDDVKNQHPDHIAITGDLTNLGLESEFQKSREWLEAVGTPDDVTIIPGNHDIYVPESVRFSNLYWDHYMRSDTSGSNFSASYEARFPFVRCFDKVALIGLDSAIPVPVFSAQGEIGESQLNMLGITLEDLGANGFFRVVLIHHPPLAQMTKERRALRDSSYFREILQENGAELVLFGHNHQRVREIIDGRQEPDTIALVEAPSASAGKSSHHSMAGYNLLTIDEGKEGWSVELVHRGLSEPNGGIVEIERRMIRGG